MSSDVEAVKSSGSEALDETLLDDASMGVRIYEDGQLVGIVNVDEKASEYHGSHEHIHDTLQRMEEHGIWHRETASLDEQPEQEGVIASESVEWEGRGLGDYLIKEVRMLRVADERDVHAEPVGFEPYPSQ